MKNLILIILLFGVSASVIAQTHVLPKYRRSSLYTLMIDDSTRERANVIKYAFAKYPVPDKFNNHNLPNRMISAKASSVDQIVTVDNYMNANNVARNLVAKWFNRSADGAFDMNLISERGMYNASEMDVKVAGLSARGKALLEDAGEELIRNTFVLVSDFKYTTMEEAVKSTRETSKDVSSGLGKLGISGRLGGLSKAVQYSTDIGEEMKGYFVKATSYLYRLDWSDSAAAVLYSEHWMDNKNLDPAKKVAFDTSKAFRLMFIGKEEAMAKVTVSFKVARRSEDSLIADATVNAVDAVIAKLQKNHEEFRTKTQLYNSDPVTAKIGKKEGLEGGERYDVLEQVESSEGRTSYEKVGTLTVDKDQVWDNRYMADVDSAKTVDCTLFKGGNKNKMFPGQLIRQR